MRSRALLALVAASALLAAPALAVADTASGRQSPVPTPFPSDWPNQMKLISASTKVETAARKRFPDTYAGNRLDLPGDALVVHRKPSPGFDEAIRALLPGVTVRYAYASHSERQVNAWTERVAADQDYWKGRGITLHGIGPDMGQGVFVEVDEPHRDDATLITHYDDLPLRVERGGPAVFLVGG
ncbi:hypothetical protein AB0H63_28200 [Micromonospora echinospora]|uniref:hypothetical protein n=1 Tax=Micromonospora echinospora TaxID=1877 RepID=UPI0033EEEE2D